MLLVAMALFGTASVSNEIEVYICQPELTWGLDLDFPECDRLYIPTAEYDVKITAYSSTTGQCDADPHITASLTKPDRATIALSRDFLKKFEKEYKKKNPNHTAPFDWGDIVWIDYGNGRRHGPFVVEDTMAKRKKMWVDLWHESTREAKEHGLRKGKLLSYYRDPNKLILSDLI